MPAIVRKGRGMRRLTVRQTEAEQQAFKAEAAWALPMANPLRSETAATTSSSCLAARTS